MSWAGWRRNALAVVIATATSAAAQQPFELDLNFRTSIQENYINSIVFLSDGDIFISGRIKFPGDQNYRGSAKLLASGQRDLTFPSFPQTTGGGKITPWSDQFYVQVSATVRRLTNEALLDPSFAQMENDPYFSPIQGGDYHVFPDGRVLLTGAHSLNDTVRGFTGTYHLIWFTNTGHLDTVRTHRRCGGSSAIYDIEPLADGKFLLSGVLSSYEGSPVGRMLPDTPGWCLGYDFPNLHTLGAGRGLSPTGRRQGDRCGALLVPRGSGYAALGEVDARWAVGYNLQQPFAFTVRR